jgi:hypothetical protein
MSLFERLQKASSEEDVKAEYIKALRLKQVQRNLIDIQTREVWFEAKFGSKKSLYEMFTQLLFLHPPSTQRWRTHSTISLRGR